MEICPVNTSPEFVAGALIEQLYELMGRPLNMTNILSDVFTVKEYLERGVKVFYWAWCNSHTAISENKLTWAPQYKISVEYITNVITVEKY